MRMEITRRDLSAADLRREAARAKDAKASRRMLALAFVLDGRTRTEAAESCGMDRQTLRDWVHRYNAEGLAGLIDRPLPSRTPILSAEQMSELSLKVTLSYFVEPYPMAGSMPDPARYRSFGLRFDLKRKRETEAVFQRRRNAAAGSRVNGEGDDEGWLFGEKAVAAGSLHSDVWSGPAVELASRDQLCTYRVMGWWRDRPSQERYLDKARYALVVTLEAPETHIDLQAKVAATANAMIPVQTTVEVETNQDRQG